MKPVRGYAGPETFDDDRAWLVTYARTPLYEIPVLILPIENDNVGGLEPWMPGYMKVLAALVGGGKLDAQSMKIATAIAAILEGGQDDV